MKIKIEIWLNIVHYCIYRLDYRLHMLSNKVNPFLLLGKIPAVKKKFEEQGTTHLDVVNKIWTDKRFGFGIMISGGGLVIFVFSIIISVYTIMNGLFRHQFEFSPLRYVISTGLAYIICYYTVFQNDKYIRYFKQFDKWSKQEKWKYGFFSFAFIFGAIALLIFSFRFIYP